MRGAGAEANGLGAEAQEGRERAKVFWVAKAETRAEESVTTGEFEFNSQPLIFEPFF